MTIFVHSTSTVMARETGSDGCCCCVWLEYRYALSTCLVSFVVCEIVARGQRHCCVHSHLSRCLNTAKLGDRRWQWDLVYVSVCVCVQCDPANMSPRTFRQWEACIWSEFTINKRLCSGQFYHFSLWLGCVVVEHDVFQYVCSRVDGNPVRVLM